MLFRRHKRRIPELNATSTADISFMLLIFFLVTTSMDLDKGLLSRLTHKDEIKQEEVLISRSNLLNINITASGELLVNDKLTALSELAPAVSKFIDEIGDKHLIQLSTDESTRYEDYFNVYDKLLKVYSDKGKEPHIVDSPLTTAGKEGGQDVH